MDGTLTTAGKFTPELWQALAALQGAGIPVLIVTGRSAGWVSGLVHYLPVAGAIAENGGLFYPDGGALATELVPIADAAHHRQQLAATFAQLQGEFPGLRESADNRFRLTDWTFDVAGVPADVLVRGGSGASPLEQRCRELGWGFTYSTVQCHIKLPQQDKAIALQQVLSRYFPELSPEQVVTVGDSPNDESLFDARRFPLSVGVANVLEYRDRLIHQPAYVTMAAEGAGFCEFVRCLLAA
jgi:hydroxymethylpyrimidine pyrophosphatase-like HAD family hydrolase